MNQEKSTIQRAFELANTGSYRSLQDIRLHLKREDYPGSAEHLAGLSIRKQLFALIRQRENDDDRTQKVGRSAASKAR